MMIHRRMDPQLYTMSHVKLGWRVWLRDSCLIHNTKVLFVYFLRHELHSKMSEYQSIFKFYADKANFLCGES
jgi:hypothetical protein